MVAWIVAGALALMGCRDEGRGWSTADTDGDEVAGQCEAEVVGPPVLRRLTRAELQATIHAVFPELGGTEVAMGPDPVSERGFSCCRSAGVGL